MYTPYMPNSATTAGALILGPILPGNRFPRNIGEAPAQHAAETAYLPLSHCFWCIEAQYVIADGGVWTW
jgi:hypothetical protein